jgi:hypothetical protein
MRDGFLVQSAGRYSCEGRGREAEAEGEEEGVRKSLLRERVRVARWVGATERLGKVR